MHGQNLGMHYLSRYVLCECVISISVSATDGPNTQLCYSLVSKPRLIACQKQQQAVCVCVCFCFNVCVRVCISICVYLQRPSSISQAVGRTPCGLGHKPNPDDRHVSSDFECVSVCICVLIYTAVCLWVCL